MFQLIYTSGARTLFSRKDIESILAVSREENLRHGVTGVLLYKAGSIVQALEGEERAVRQLFSNIEKDRRHHNVTVIFTQFIEVREFAEWTMGFSCVEFEMETRPDGSHPIPGTADRLAITSGRAATLIKSFVATTR